MRLSAPPNNEEDSAYARLLRIPGHPIYVHDLRPENAMKESDGRRHSNPDSPTYLTRRAFVVGSLAAGFALAVLPVSAETIITDSKDLVAGEITIPVAGG